MKFEIKDDEDTFVINDNNLDYDAFVDISISTKLFSNIEMTVPLDQLMSAVIAFESKRSRRLLEERKCDCV